MVLASASVATAQPNTRITDRTPATCDSQTLVHHLARARALLRSAYDPQRSEPERLLIDKAQAHSRCVGVENTREAIHRYRVLLAKRYRRHQAEPVYGSIDPPGAAYLAGLRACESGGVYTTNTGNGFYGAYQFDIGTWGSVGGSGLPSDASPAEQDYRAAVLWRQRGSAPWPVCG